MEKKTKINEKIEDVGTVENEVKAKLEKLRMNENDFNELQEKSIYFEASNTIDSEQIEIKSKQEKREEYIKALCTVHEAERLRWMEKHGKSKFVHFRDEYRKKIRKAFESLDSKRCGFIGREDLEDALIGLGLIETTTEVDQIMKDIDKDDSGTIEFSEFFSVLNTRDNPGKSLKILNFFTEFQSESKKKGEEDTKDLPFSLFASQDRRKYLLKAIFDNDTEGKKRLEAFKTSINDREKKRQKEEFK